METGTGELYSKFSTFDQTVKRGTYFDRSLTLFLRSTTSVKALEEHGAPTPTLDGELRPDPNFVSKSNLERH